MDYRHLKTLTYNTGIIQFSVNDTPDINSGYTVDDNARALIVALEIEEKEEREKYARIYASFLYSAQRSDGSWCNLKLHNRFVPTLDSEDSLGRAFLACSIAALCNIEDVSLLARKMVLKSLPVTARLTFPRATAYALIGITKVIPAFKQHYNLMVNIAKKFGSRLVSLYERFVSPGWKWFEEKLTYCNGILPHALFSYYSLSKDKKALHTAQESLNFLGDSLLNKGYLHIVGNRGWWQKGRPLPLYDQQPVDACSTALACLEAFRVTGKKDYFTMAQLSHAWYWGKNTNKTLLYNQKTGGCYDALTPEGVNLNQGAESLISFLLTERAFAQIERTADSEFKKPKTVI